MDILTASFICGEAIAPLQESSNTLFPVWCGFLTETTTKHLMYCCKLISSAGTRKTNSWSDRLNLWGLGWEMRSHP
ncbi:hypothetical protein [Nostoc sp. FACHB-888]|uniref:hypothetical protein n=1 Tax=Nostoc sp. FACHB-888 TaxID=2692842 RepID=UPI001681C761|nr:hypothetical protein [Nostoc sp. FACHB-888]MBD2242363.1 hypothetical protein [Nostoc sp. FACHB-888]